MSGRCNGPRLPKLGWKSASTVYRLGLEDKVGVSPVEQRFEVNRVTSSQRILFELSTKLLSTKEKS